MGWSDVLNNILQRYSGAGGGTASAPEDADADFDQVAQFAPREELAGGISQAFRSDKTPPFPEMVANLFSRSDPSMRAGLLSRLLGSGGSGMLSSLPGLGVPGLLSAGNPVTMEQAGEMEPSQVREIAAKAEQDNPGIMDDIARFYSEHPGVFKALGGLALSVAIQHMARRR